MTAKLSPQWIIGHGYTLWDVGQLAVATGHTTQEELSRVLGVDDLSPAEVPAASPLLTGGFETDSEQSAGTPV